jgi:hypothetical protein
MGAAVILAAASRLLSAADAGAIAMASGALQQCLGISPRTQRWLPQRREHDLVIAGKLRFALGAADPSGITFHRSAERTAWLQRLTGRVNASEAMTFWQMRRDEFDSCMRRGGQNCREPGPKPQ